MKRTKNVLKIMAMVAAIFFLLSCNPLEDDTKSSSMLMILSILGYDAEDNEQNYLQSDVLDVDPKTLVASVRADSAKATLTARMLDPAPLLPPSHHNSITVNRYVVSYFRSDGRNVEGVDIPYSFEGSLTALVEIGANVNVSFIVVREVAKLEPPLINLAESGLEGGDEVVLQVTARIDFYGYDTINNKVKATGYLPIFFANYADKEEEG